MKKAREFLVKWVRKEELTFAHVRSLTKYQLLNLWQRIDKCRQTLPEGTSSQWLDRAAWLGKLAMAENDIMRRLGVGPRRFLSSDDH